MDVFDTDERPTNGDRPKPIRLAAIVALLPGLSRCDLHMLRHTIIPDLMREKTRAIETGWPEPQPFVTKETTTIDPLV